MLLLLFVGERYLTKTVHGMTFSLVLSQRNLFCLAIILIYRAYTSPLSSSSSDFDAATLAAAAVVRMGCTLAKAACAA